MSGHLVDNELNVSSILGGIKLEFWSTSSKLSIASLVVNKEVTDPPANLQEGLF